MDACSEEWERRLRTIEVKQSQLEMNREVIR